MTAKHLANALRSAPERAKVMIEIDGIWRAIDAVQIGSIRPFGSKKPGRPIVRLRAK